MIMDLHRIFMEAKYSVDYDDFRLRMAKAYGISITEFEAMQKFEEEIQLVRIINKKENDSKEDNNN